jgi:hypothetical protein
MPLKLGSSTAIYSTGNFKVKNSFTKIAQNLLIRGGSLSFSEAVNSPIALALHSGRFALMQQGFRKIPGYFSRDFFYSFFIDCAQMIAN